MGRSLLSQECLDNSGLRLHSRPHPRAPQVTPGRLRSPAVTVHRRMTDRVYIALYSILSLFITAFSAAMAPNYRLDFEERVFIFLIYFQQLQLYPWLKQRAQAPA